MNQRSRRTKWSVKAMGLVQLDRVLEDYVQRNPLPALFGGVILGILLALLAMFVVRMAKGRRLVGMIKELKERNHHLTTANQDLNKEVGRFQGQIKGLERENELLNDRVKNHDGHINAQKERIAELSSDCERLRTESIDIREKFRREKKILSEIQEVARRYSERLDSIAQSDGKLWLGSSSSGQSVQFLPLPSRLAAIISVANLKGGVGKTTMTANLGAVLAKEGLRVLLLDLDYQSSLTSLCLSPPERDEVKRSRRYFNDLLANGGDLIKLNQCVTLIQTKTGSGQLYLAPVNEDFADVENQLMARWYSRLGGDDVRFRLRSALHSSHLRDFYDVVLIDCPPRLTTGCINALAASDYVLIPVLLEEISTEAVPRLLSWLKKFQAHACEDLGVLGVVGNKAFPRAKLINRQAIIWNRLGAKCRGVWGDSVRLFGEVIRDHCNVRGRFAALDPNYEDQYRNLVAEIRKEIPHARLQPSAVPHLATATAESGGD
jgi:cellulose biosynthesis protein BcsQ